jgi:hypothetical protein
LNIVKFKRLEEISKSLVDYNSSKRCHHFSFVLYKNRIISIGYNSQKTHPVNLKNRKKSLKTGEDFSDQKYVCSEFSAINKLKNMTNIDSKKCVLVNLRYNRNGKVDMSKPCMSCENLLKYFNFKKVIWTNNNGDYICGEDA